MKSSSTGARFRSASPQMSYQARLDRVMLAGKGPNRLQVAFALKDFVIRIGEIDVSDARTAFGPGRCRSSSVIVNRSGCTSKSDLSRRPRERCG